MRKYLPTLRFLLPWLCISLALGGLVLWLIVSADLSKTATVVLVSIYLNAMTALVWFVVPLAPPKR